MFHIEVDGGKLLSQVDPLVRNSDVWFRWDWMPPTGIVARVVTVGRPASDATPAWTVTGRTTNVHHEADSHDRNAIQIMRPGRGDRIDVRCHIGSELVTRRIWIVKGQVSVRDRGVFSPRNRREAISNAMQQSFTDGHIQSQLGLYTHQNRREGICVYGALVEILGIVDPWDVPSRFHLVRRVISSTVNSSNGTRIEQRRAGDDDTSHADMLDQTLSRQGEVYDIDAPGSHFISTDSVNTRHNWNVRFEQLLVIGPLQPNAWQAAQSQALAVSPPQQWCINYHARVVLAGAPPMASIEGTITG